MTFQRIAVIGAGAVGAYYGGRLAAAGHRVDFFTRSDAAALREKGLRVRSVAGDFTVGRPNAYDDTAAMPRADLVVVALKATARPHYVDLVKPVAGDDATVVCLQNGLGNEDVFADAFGPGRVLGAIAYTCINRVGPGEIEHTAHGQIRVGSFGAAATTQAESVAALMRSAAIDATAVDDLNYWRWQKLIWNVPFNGWGAALDRHSAALLATPGGERLVRDTMAEVIAAAGAAGVSLDPAMIDQQIASTRRMGDYHSSMHLDRLAGRAMETDAVLAEPLRRAKASGGPGLPLMETMLRCLRVF